MSSFPATLTRVSDAEFHERSSDARLGLPLNLWAAAPEVVADRGRSGPVTWGGNLPGDPHAAVDLLSGLDRAGAGWAVFSWPGSTVPILEAATAAGIR